MTPQEVVEYMCVPKRYAKYVKLAQSMLGKKGVPNEAEDLIQSVVLDILEERKVHDPSKGDVNTFLVYVINAHVHSQVREYYSVLEGDPRVSVHDMYEWPLPESYVGEYDEFYPIQVARRDDIDRIFSMMTPRHVDLLERRYLLGHASSRIVVDMGFPSSSALHSALVRARSSFLRQWRSLDHVTPLSCVEAGSKLIGKYHKSLDVPYSSHTDVNRIWDVLEQGCLEEVV